MSSEFSSNYSRHRSPVDEWIDYRIANDYKAAQEREEFFLFYDRMLSNTDSEEVPAKVLATLYSLYTAYEFTRQFEAAATCLRKAEQVFFHILGNSQGRVADVDLLQIPFMYVHLELYEDAQRFVTQLTETLGCECGKKVCKCASTDSEEFAPIVILREQIDYFISQRKQRQTMSIQYVESLDIERALQGDVEDDALTVSRNTLQAIGERWQY